VKWLTALQTADDRTGLFFSAPHIGNYSLLSSRAFSLIASAFRAGNARFFRI